MNNDDSDSDSSSCVEHLMAKAAANRQVPQSRRVVHKNDNEYDDDDNDDDDDDDDDKLIATRGSAPLSAPRSTGNKRSHCSVDVQLLKLERRTILRERRRVAYANAADERSSDDEDTDDDDPDHRRRLHGSLTRFHDPNAIRITIERQKENDHEQLAYQAKSAAPTVADLLSSDDDDNNDKNQGSVSSTQRLGFLGIETTTATTTTGHALQQQQQQQPPRLPMDTQWVAEILQARQAADRLIRAQTQTTIMSSGWSSPTSAETVGTGTAGLAYPHHQHHHYHPNHPNASAAAAALMPMTQSIAVTVRAKIHCLGSTEIREQVVPMTAIMQEPIKAMIDRCKENLGMKQQQCTVAITFHGQAIQESRTLAFYSIPNGATIIMNLYGSTFAASARRSSNTGGGVASRESLKELGKTMQLILRCTGTGQLKSKDSNNDQDRVTVHIRRKETLRVLVQRYQQAKQLPAGTIVQLRFDGECLQLEKTPESYDMDDDDLIEVSY